MPLFVEETVSAINRNDRSLSRERRMCSDCRFNEMRNVLFSLCNCLQNSFDSRYHPSFLPRRFGRNFIRKNSAQANFFKTILKGVKRALDERRRSVVVHDRRSFPLLSLQGTDQSAVIKVSSSSARSSFHQDFEYSDKVLRRFNVCLNSPRKGGIKMVMRTNEPGDMYLSARSIVFVAWYLLKMLFSNVNDETAV